MKKYFTLFLFLIACFSIFYGYTFYQKSNTIAQLDARIKMGRYQDAMATVLDVENSMANGLFQSFSKEDPIISYNKGILYALMENKKKAANEYRKAMDTDDVALKAKAIYNNANLLASDMDFSSAAMQYAEALKIDDDDFQAKKNLERMRLGEQQFNTLFSPEQQEREDRVEALKLLPWGTKYKYSGEQKLRW
ncbi:MAG: hypothetical protein HW390_281 [Candidatus Brocadiaceae bacterium]|nr:hypothetical protein [Candidatus Brocadiaceae bacterium]